MPATNGSSRVVDADHPKNCPRTQWIECPAAWDRLTADEDPDPPGDIADSATAWCTDASRSLKLLGTSEPGTRLPVTCQRMPRSARVC